MHQNKIVSILSLTQLTMITYFPARKIPTLPKSFWFFLIQISLYNAAFPLIILTDFPLNLVSCTQQMSADLHSKISSISPEPSLRVPTYTLQTWKSTNFVSSRGSPEAVARICSMKKVCSVKKTPVSESFFLIKLQTWGLQLY